MATESAAFDRASHDLRVFVSTRESRCDDCGRQSRRIVSELRGSRSPHGPVSRRRGAHAAGPKVFHARRHRAEMEPRTQAVRTPGTAGRGRSASTRRGRVPEGCGGSGEAPRTRGGTARRIGRCACCAVRGTYSPALPGLPGRSGGANRFARVQEVQRPRRTQGCGQAPRRGAVRLAVVAHVRHDETRYDELLARGVERWDARDRVRENVDRVLSRWCKVDLALRSEDHGSRDEKEEEQASQAGGPQANAPDQDDD